jgi:hypothetical protein
MSVSLPPNHEPASDPNAGIAEQRWQFSLRALFIWVALAGSLFAVLSRVGPLWSAAIVWFLILVAGHVLGNSWSAKFGRSKILADDQDGELPMPLTRRPVTFAPATRLREKTALGWIMPTVTVIAAMLGGTVGGLGLVWLHWGEVAIAGLLVGTISAAILGGFFGFLTSSFVDVMARAFCEAAGERKR